MDPDGWVDYPHTDGPYWLALEGNTTDPVIRVVYTDSDGQRRVERPGDDVDLALEKYIGDLWYPIYPPDPRE